MLRRLIRIILQLIILLTVIIASFLFYIYLTDYKPSPTETLSISTHTKPINDSINIFSFFCWNIGYAGLDKDMDFFYDGGKKTRTSRESTIRNLREIIKTISESGHPDFIFLQEVDSLARRTYNMNQYNSIGKSFPEYSSTFVKNYDVKFVPMPPAKPMGRVIAGLMTLSAYKPVESYRVALDGEFSFPTGLFMLDRCYHLQRFTLNNGKSLVTVNTHNTAFDDGSQRKKQIENLRELALKEYAKGNFVIIGGDFNTNPQDFDPEKISPSYNSYKQDPAINTWDFGSGWNFSYDTKIPTNRNLDNPYVPGKTPVTSIDFFITSPNITIIESKTYDLGFEFSDHNPVAIKIKLNK